LEGVAFGFKGRFMNTSVVLARIIGPLLIITVAGSLMNFTSYQGMAREFFKSPALIYLGGFIGLLCGLLIVQFHNVWKVQWPLIITVLGWVLVVRATITLLFPNRLAALAERFMMSSTSVLVSVLVMLAIGVFLTIMGYRR
jgi:hypothetical protein